MKTANVRRSPRIANKTQPPHSPIQIPQIPPKNPTTPTPLPTPKQTQQQTILEQQINKEKNDIRNYLTMIDMNLTPTQKVNDIISLFEYLMNHNKFIATNSHFREVVKTKIKELKFDAQYSNISEYLQEKFLLACKYLEKTVNTLDQH
jgi:hypothetical protein